jgi:cytochrome c-type biogenesis protein CcmF
MQKSPYNKQTITSIFSKSTAIFANNIVLTAILLIILTGILYPMLHKLITHNTIVVDENFYTKSLSVPGLALLAIMALYMSKRVTTFLVVLAISMALTCAIYYLQPMDGVIKILFVILSITALISALPSIKKNITAGLAHTGFAILILGCSLYYAWHFEGSALITKGVTQQIGKYSVTLQEIKHFKRDNFLVRQAVIEIQNTGTVAPETRFYPVEKSFTTESSIIHTFTGDIYSTIGEIKDKKILLRLQFKPFISLIWLGVAVIALSIPIGVIRWKIKSTP